MPLDFKILTYAALPLIAALIGWFTNYLAVKMIFRPYKPTRFLGITFHGVMPRRQHELARTLGQTVEQELISHKDVRDALSTPEMQREVLRVVEEQVDVFLNDTLGKLPLLKPILHGEPLRALRAGIIKQLFGRSLAQALDSLLEKAEQQLDFKQIVQKKIEDYDLSRLEEIVYRVAGKELRSIELLGAVLGFIVGLAQVALLTLAEQL